MNGLITDLRRVIVRNADRLLPVGVLLLAAVLRFHLLGAQSLWNDEGNSLRLAQRPISELLTAAAQDIHPPGYYLALKIWINLTGDSEFTLRALSALAALLTVACVYALGKALFAPGAGLLAAALVAVNSFEVYYGQEARMYAALALWTAASLCLFVRWTAKPAWRTGLALALVNAAGLYTHYTYPLVMVAQGALFLAYLALTPPLPSYGRGGRGVRAYLVLNVLTLLLFLPQLPTAIRQVSSWPHTGQPIDTLTGLAAVGHWLVYGNTSPATEWWMYFWPVVFVFIAFLPDWVNRKQPFAWRLALPWVLIALTAGSLFALNLFRDANLKFLLPAQIGAALLIGRGAWLLWELGSPNWFILIEAVPRIAAGFGLLAIAYFANDALDNLYNNPAFARDDYRAIARVINADPRPGDLILLDAPNQSEAFSYYYHGPAPVIGLPAGLGGDDPATRDQLTQALTNARRVYALFWGEDERDPQRVVESTLDSAAFPAWTRWFGNVRVVAYAVSGTASDTPAQTIDADFGGLIRLQGVTIGETTVHAGDVLDVRLFWQAEKPIPQRYKVFVQLLNAEGELVAQNDSEPVNNTSLTTSWQPGQTIVDNHGLALSPDLPPGNYRLIAGLYDINNPSARLPVDGGDQVALGAIILQ
ncbi:MAG: glycosyltransferase family 39 protein [Aggregatilineales bacterium]